MEEFPEHASTSSEPQHHGEYDSVVMGLSPAHLNYDTLTTAFRVLSSSGSSSPKPLITTHRAKYIRTPDGELSLGPGPFARTLEEAMGSDFMAEAVGKPGKTFFDRVIGSIDDPQSSLKSNSQEKVVIIGDDIEADLGGAAVELGLWRVLGQSSSLCTVSYHLTKNLVKTGKYRANDERREGQRPPDELQESFATFVDSLLS